MPKKLQFKKGFTLIELLVVIGILGILAAGLLAAVDPLEQLKKGRDTQRRNVAVELNNALVRYYAVYGVMPAPWGTLTYGPTSIAAAAGNLITTLINTGELKPSFNNGIPPAIASQIVIIGDSAAAGSAPYICFDPESKSISLDPTTIFSSTAVPPGTAAGCNPPTATTGCYFCAR